MDEHYLAIDWGERKIGLALADHETRIAFALHTIESHKAIADDIKEIIAEHTVSDVVIGVPQHQNFSEGEDKAQAFGEKIARDNNISVHYVNEMFSSKMAQENRKKAGAGNISADDAEAARILLEGWLDQATK